MGLPAARQGGASPLLGGAVHACLRRSLDVTTPFAKSLVGDLNGCCLYLPAMEHKPEVVVVLRLGTS